MDCPRCQSDEISTAGICLVCGYRIEASAPATRLAPAEAVSQVPSDTAATDQSGGIPETSSKEDLPLWRQELSQRLNAIRQSKGANEGAERSLTEPNAPQPPKLEQRGAEQQRIPRVDAPGKTPVRKTVQSAQRQSERPRPSAPQQKALASLEPEALAATPAAKSVEHSDIQQFIDRAVSRQSSRTGTEPTISAPRPIPDHEGKLILLSRTLSGLIDLIFIVLCTGVFVISADYFSGIVVLDAASVINYSVLLLLIYFLYSIFFLAASNQTIGMMITDLRVVGASNKRPSTGQLFYRCLGYLVSVGGLGIGLLWSLFDRENLCLHDRLSRTNVIRI
jgi:uncharacterized RDD family membrane protein YckC